MINCNWIYNIMSKVLYTLLLIGAANAFLCACSEGEDKDFTSVQEICWRQTIIICRPKVVFLLNMPIRR